MGAASQNLPFLFAAFAVVWVVFLAYAGYMSWKRQALQRDLQELSREMTDSAPATHPADHAGTRS